MHILIGIVIVVFLLNLLHSRGIINLNGLRNNLRELSPETFDVLFFAVDGEEDVQDTGDDFTAQDDSQIASEDGAQIGGDGLETGSDGAQTDLAPVAPAV